MFTALRSENWDTELITRVYVVAATGGEPEQLTGDDASYDDVSSRPTGRQSRIGTPSRTGRPHGTHRSASWTPTARNTRCSRPTLDRQCGPYPDRREPIWDGGRIVFTIEDGGNVHLYAVAADGSSQPELLVGGEQVISGLRRPRRVASCTSPRRTRRCASCYLGVEGRRADARRPGIRRGPGARRARALHRRLCRRLRGRRLDRPAGGLRAGKTLSGTAHVSTAGRSRSTARRSSTSSRCTRAAATRSSSRIRAAARGTPRSTVARSAGRSAAQAPAGASRTTKT